MKRLPHPLARWLKLMLACVALAALAPSQAAASAPAVTAPIAHVEGGGDKPNPSKARLRSAQYSPPVAPRRLVLETGPAAAHASSHPRAIHERLFLRHCSLLR